MAMQAAVYYVSQSVPRCSQRDSTSVSGTEKQRQLMRVIHCSQTASPQQQMLSLVLNLSAMENRQLTKLQRRNLVQASTERVV